VKGGRAINSSTLRRIEVSLRVVAGVGRREETLAAHGRQAAHEGVGGEGRVNVQVAEEDATARLGQLGRRALLSLEASGHRLRGQRRSRDLARSHVRAAAVDDVAGKA